MNRASERRLSGVFFSLDWIMSVETLYLCLSNSTSLIPVLCKLLQNPCNFWFTHVFSLAHLVEHSTTNSDGFKVRILFRNLDAFSYTLSGKCCYHDRQDGVNVLQSSARQRQFLPPRKIIASEQNHRDTGEMHPHGGKPELSQLQEMGN